MHDNGSQRVQSSAPSPEAFINSIVLILLVCGFLAVLMGVAVVQAPRLESRMLRRRAARLQAQGTLESALARCEADIATLEDKWAGLAGRHARTTTLGGAGPTAGIGGELERKRAWRRALLAAGRAQGGG